MRAFLHELDRELLIAASIGLVLGAVWLAVTGVGISLAWLAIVGAATAWILRRRWLEVGVLMLSAGLVPAIGYRLFGPPDVPPRRDPRTVLAETFAPALAELLVAVGLASIALVAVLGFREGRRRERLEAAHHARREARLADRP